MRGGYSWFAWLRLHRHLPHETLNLINSRERKTENLTCNNPAGSEAVSTAWGCLSNVTYKPAVTALWTDVERHII